MDADLTQGFWMPLDKLTDQQIWKKTRPAVRHVWNTFVNRLSSTVPLRATHTGKRAVVAAAEDAKNLKKVQPEVFDRQAILDPNWPLPTLRPGAGNLLEERPYFTVPLGDASIPGAASEVAQMVGDYVANVIPKIKPVTDIYVVSHGWHRNLFTGIAAYDRLFSRLILLRRRGVIEDPSPDFNPLYLAIQWISDPGASGFLDPQGRRHRQSFIDAVEAKFDSSSNAAQFVDLFEKVFQILSESCAPAASLISAASRQSAAHAALTSSAPVALGIDNFPLKLAPQATYPEKCTVIWSCYHESLAKAVLCDQEEAPRPTATIWHTAATFGKFVFGIVGAGAVLGLLTGVLKFPGVRPPSLDHLRSQFWLSYKNPLQWQPDWAFWTWPGIDWAKTLKMTGLVVGSSAIYLAVCAAYFSMQRKASDRNVTPRPGNQPYLLTLAWLVVQVVAFIPALLYLLSTYFFRTGLFVIGLGLIVSGRPWLGTEITLVVIWYALALVLLKRPAGYVFPEKLRERGNDPRYLQEYLVSIARLPINLIKRAAPADSFAVKAAMTIDNQFAFFEMQRKGVKIGDDAAAFLDEALSKIAATQDISNIRLHFIGHSFGGLVVLNAVRGLIQRMGAPPAKPSLFSLTPAGTTAEEGQLPVEIRSLCVIQSATASDWFSGEDGIEAAVTGAVSCIYSRYDTANGVYYPFANCGRMAAGDVGLCEIGSTKMTPAAQGKDRFISLIGPPALDLPAAGTPRYLNLDASRLIYEGRVALGGGHDDIFKDDVVNLIWSCVSI